MDPGGDPSSKDISFGSKLPFFGLVHSVLCPSKLLLTVPYVSEHCPILGHFGRGTNVIKASEGSVDNEPLLDVRVKHLECHIIDVPILGWGNGA